MREKVQWFLGIVFSLALILVLLINSFQFAAYGDLDLRKEYKNMMWSRILIWS